MLPPCSIFFHNYYGSHESWMNYFTKNLTFSANLYYNMVEDSMYNRDLVESSFFNQYQPASNDSVKKLVVRQSSNKGKDIGGKLVLLDAFQRLGMQTKYGLFLHDKKSPYKVNSTTWAKNLFTIATPPLSQLALQYFEDNPRVGIVAAKGSITDDYDYEEKSFKTNNRLLLPVLLDQFAIKPASFQYVAGTMFWFRMTPVNLFFEKHAPLKIREMLEQGNVMDEYKGTNTHSWERLLCWIITGQNYTIKTI